MSMQSMRRCLHRAARDGDIDRSSDLSLWDDVNLFDDMGLTPLHYAAQGKQIEAAAVLLRSGALVNENHDATIRTSPAGWARRHACARKGRTDAVGGKCVHLWQRIREALVCRRPGACVSRVTGTGMRGIPSSLLQEVSH
jgi:hypothetical protein